MEKAIRDNVQRHFESLEVLSKKEVLEKWNNLSEYCSSLEQELQDKNKTSKQIQDS